MNKALFVSFRWDCVYSSQRKHLRLLAPLKRIVAFNLVVDIYCDTVKILFVTLPIENICTSTTCTSEDPAASVGTI